MKSAMEAKASERVRGRRGLALRSGCALALAAVLTSSTAWAQSRFGADATVVLVEVPVNVIRDGDPVRGLTREDFVLFDGREKQEITGFEVIDLGSIDALPEDQRLAIPSMRLAARRQIVLLFDLSFSDLQSMARARTAALEIVEQSLAPSDLVAVATYGQAAGTNLVQGFTGNREQAKAAIRNLGRRGWRQAVTDPLGLILDPGPADAGDSTNQGQSERAALADENARDLEALADQAEGLYSKHQFTHVTASFEKLADLLSTVEGRKQVVLLSEGYASEILTGVDDIARQIEIAQLLAFGQIGQYSTEERYGHSDAASSLVRMTEAFRRADCTIHAVDLSGLDDNAKTSRNAAMFRMANETGGELLQNYNDVGKALGEVIERTSVTYVLSFAPSNVEMDGPYRPLKVKLKKRRSGARVLHRPGYFPPRSFSRLSPAERRLATTAEVLAGSAGGPVEVSVLAAPFNVPGRRPYVPVLIEVSGSSLLATAAGDEVVTELFAYAFDENGAARDFFARRLSLDLTTSRAQLLDSGLKYWGHLDLAPGDYVVRVLVRNGLTGVAGVASLPLHVADFAAGESALLPMLFPEPAGKWVLARESEAELRAEVAFPFTLDGNPFIPAVRPALSTAPTRASLVGYNLGEGELTVSTLLLDAEDTPVQETSPKLVGACERRTVSSAWWSSGIPGCSRPGFSSKAATD